MDKTRRFGLLARIAVAIAAGTLGGLLLPGWFVRAALTFNGIFTSLLGFIVPLLILGLVAFGIAELGRNAGRLLALTALLAYAFTLFSGFGTFFTCRAFLPSMIASEGAVGGIEAVEGPAPFFTIDIPPLMSVMSALVLAMMLGLGVAYTQGVRLRALLEEFRDVVSHAIEWVILPLLPLYVFGLFLSMTYSGQVVGVLTLLLKLVALIFCMTVVLLLVQFSLAGIAARRNPFGMLRVMLAAYLTALGTQSSAATIPVTLACVKRIGVRASVADFVVPLCATIHLSGSMMKIVACAMAVAMMAGDPVSGATFSGFILLLAITMVAAPGVPGGAIMASVGLLESVLGFDSAMIGLMITVYIAMDSFGTATNVTGDGAVAVIVDRVAK